MKRVKPAEIPAVDPAERRRTERRATDRPTRRDRRHDPLEREWSELTGSGRTQVSHNAALRARDADRPTEGELARAEAETVIQRRNWKPS